MDKSRWISAFFFFPGDVYREEADRLLLEGLGPLVENCLNKGLAQRWFFIRYTEDGAHLRLRFWAREENLEALQAAVKFAADQAIASGLMSELRWVDYEPEVERYGGPQGLALAEEIFQLSSETALALLRGVSPGDRPARFGKSLLAMVVLLQIFEGDRRNTAEIAAIYGNNYLRALVPDPQTLQRWIAMFEQGYERQAGQLAEYVEAAWEALEEGDALTPTLDPYRDQLKLYRDRLLDLSKEGKLSGPDGPLVDWRSARRWIVPSYAHMMNNRLGVSIQDESYLSVLIHLTLKRSAAASSQASAPAS